MELCIEPLTPALAPEFFRFFEQTAYTEHKEWGRDCYCCFFHAPSKEEWEARSGDDNRQAAARMIAAGEMTGLLAFADDIPVGWCHFAAKAELPGLRVFYPETAGGDGGCGSIVCFTVAQGYRHMGIAARLLEAACVELARAGFSAAEAYPLAGQGTEEEQYHGPAAMYLRHGFAPVRQNAGMTVMRRPLG